MSGPTEHDWPEHWSHKDGQHICECLVCGVEYMAHKSSMICRKCFHEKPVPMPEIE